MGKNEPHEFTKIEHVANIPEAAAMDRETIYLAVDDQFIGFICPCGCGCDIVVWNANVIKDRAPSWTIDETGGRATCAPSFKQRFCGAHFFINSGAVRWV